MGLNCSSRIISLHLQECSGTCPNAPSCYHLNKDFKKGKVDKTLLLRSLADGFQVFDTACKPATPFQIRLLREYDNYHLTISCLDYIPLNFDDHINKRIQLSVYTLDQMKVYKNLQKLFLIKDKESLDLALFLMETEGSTGKLHFILDQNFCTEEVIRNVIIPKFNEHRDIQHSMDTCLTSWIVNGHCPYENNYIDVTYDATVRKCPYAKTGFDMGGYNTMDELYKVSQPINCIYNDLFKGRKNG